MQTLHRRCGSPRKRQPGSCACAIRIAALPRNVRSRVGWQLQASTGANMSRLRRCGGTWNGSVMHARISLWSRRIELTRGEAMFDVAHETLRSFEVRAAGTVLHDIGTRFDVQLEQNAVTVEVLEGGVEVRPPSDKSHSLLLTAGNRAISDANGISGLARVDAESAGAWVSGRWIFRDTPLDEVVRELNRYHPQQTELADPSLGSLRKIG